MSQPITKFQPFPNFYVYRPGYMVVPLIPLDELPSWIQVGDFDWSNSSLYASMLPASFNCFPRIGEYDIICHHCYKNVDSFHRSVSERSDSNASSHASDHPKGIAAPLPANSILLDPSFKLEQPPFGASLNVSPFIGMCFSSHPLKGLCERLRHRDREVPPPVDPPVKPPVNPPPDSPDPVVTLEEGTPLQNLSPSGQGSRVNQASQATQTDQASETTLAVQEPSSDQTVSPIPSVQAAQPAQTVSLAEAARAAHTPPALDLQNTFTPVNTPIQAAQAAYTAHAASASASVEQAQSQRGRRDEAEKSGAGNSSRGIGDRVASPDDSGSRGLFLEDDMSSPLSTELDNIDAVIGAPSGVPVDKQ
ncbi:hypothetical protein AbraIFM66951_001671, partial [Aspergillus brasiliensis]